MNEWVKMNIYNGKLEVIVRKHFLNIMYDYNIPEEIRYLIKIKDGKVFLRLIQDDKRGYKLINSNGVYHAFLPVNYLKLGGLKLDKYNKIKTTIVGKRTIKIEFGKGV